MNDLIVRAGIVLGMAGFAILAAGLLVVSLWESRTGPSHADPVEADRSSGDGPVPDPDKKTA